MEPYTTKSGWVSQHFKSTALVAEAGAHAHGEDRGFGGREKHGPVADELHAVVAVDTQFEHVVGGVREHLADGGAVHNSLHTAIAEAPGEGLGSRC